jgi:DNA-directed RNA polymerase specialized sigma24 family protein
MTRSGAVTLWIAEIKEGRREAVARLLDCYFKRLIGLARQRLGGQPELAGYEEDVALSAFKSLCLGAERGQFSRLLDRDDLWHLLVVLTVRKAIDLLRRRRPEAPAAPEDLEQLLSRDPDPELAAEVADEYRRLFDGLGDPELRAVALWKVEGYSNEEISRNLGCVVRSVERKLQLIRALWAEAFPA